MPAVELFPELNDALADTALRSEKLSAERREALDALAAHVAERHAAGEPARLIFICTHNSRRSQFAQVWAAAAAAYFGVGSVRSYSGGSESTAFNPRAVAALERAGFQIEVVEEGDNPRYQARYAAEADPLVMYSKVFEEAVKTGENFVAIMTCSEADASCPFVPGATLRLSLPYDDPKASDGTPEEAASYDERSEQVATEMAYVFRKVAPGPPG